MASEPDSFVLVQPTEVETTENVDQLASRLLASRYGELRCLRQLAVASKNAPSLEAAFHEQIQPARGARAGPSSDRNGGPARRSDQAEAAAEELRALSSSRRVSGLGAAFRSRMEAIFAGAQQLGAPRRTAAVGAAHSPHRRPRPAPVPAGRRRPAQIELRRELARLRRPRRRTPTGRPTHASAARTRRR